MLNLSAENEIDVNALNADGRTPLDLCDDLEEFKKLAENATPETLKNTLRYLSQGWNGDRDDTNANKIKFLIIDKKVEKDGYQKWDFISSALGDDFELFILEVEMIKNPTVLSNFSLALTAIYSNDSEALKAIIKDDIEVLKEVSDEKNLVYYSIFHKNLEALQILIDADRKNLKEIEGWVSVLEKKDINNETPVFLATLYNIPEALQILIDADRKNLKEIEGWVSVLEKKDINNETPVFLAIDYNNSEALQIATPPFLKH